MLQKFVTMILQYLTGTSINGMEGIWEEVELMSINTDDTIIYDTNSELLYTVILTITDTNDCHTVILTR